MSEPTPVRSKDRILVTHDEFRRRRFPAEETGLLVSKPRFEQRVISAVGESYPVASVYADPQKIEIEDLYPDLPDNSSLSVALRLLDRGLECIQQAREDFRAEDFVAADLATMSLATALAELFCFRSLGEGFGNVIHSLIWALSSRRGIPLEADQLDAVQACLAELRDAPFLSYDRSMDLVEGLEDAALAAESPHLDMLIDDNAE